MGFLDRAIKRAVSNAVGDAVEKGIRKAVEPKIEQAATNAINTAAGQFNQAADSARQNMQPQSTSGQSTVNQAEVQQAANTLGGLFGGLTNAATSFANEAAKNMKICPACGEAANAAVKFCPKCGGKMPEQTVAQGAICSSCGTQNSVGTKFCQSCGSKLPSAVAEEQASAERDAAVIAQWDQKLSAYPKWNCGGRDFSIEEYTPGYVSFTPNFFGNDSEAQQAVRQYREILMQNGFCQAGEYPSVEHLYKKIDGVCYHVDTEHCFDGDSDLPTFGFDISEPTGGFDYVKPEPKKQASWKDLFGIN